MDTSSLMGLVIIDGSFYQRYVDRTGQEHLVPVPEHTLAGEDQVDTETVPAPWHPQTGSAIERASPDMSMEEIRRRFACVEALLVKAFASSRGEQVFDTRGNSQLRELIQDLCLIMGGEWAARVKDIH